MGARIYSYEELAGPAVCDSRPVRCFNVCVFFFYARVLGIEPMNARTGEYLYSYAKGNIPINRLPRTECNRAKVRVELKGAL